MLTNTKVDIIQGSGSYLINAAIYTPDNYTATKKYPLIIFGHGTGEAGTNISTLYGNGLPKVLQSGFVPPFECIIVMPQAPSYGVRPEWLPAILEDVTPKYSIDKTKMIVTGLSAGGWVTWGSQFNISVDLAKQFIGVLPLSGATQDTVKTNFDWVLQVPTPALAIVGGNDISYKEQNQYMVSEINKRVPGLAQIVIRSGVGHGGWTEIYNGTYKLPDGTTVWDWMSKLINNAQGTTPPTTLPDTTVPPTTVAPTTVAPTTIPPTTIAPTTTTIPPTTIPEPTVVSEVVVTLQYMSDGTVRIKQ